MPSKGRLSQEHKQFILDNCSTMSDKEIASAINRTAEAVTNYRQKFIGKGKDTEKGAEVAAELRYKLRDRPYWKNIKKQFDYDERELFEFHWTRMIQQFQGDVWATEEMQIMDLIRLEILMERNLFERNSASKKIAELEGIIYEQLKKEEGDMNVELIITLENKVAQLRNSHETRTNEYKKLHEAKAKVFNDLKATRQQRIDKIQDAKTSFVGWMKSLEDEKNRMSISNEMELMRIATEKEKEKLQKNHKYDDGEIDIPYLTPELIDGE